MGGGFIGLEVAASATPPDCRPTVIEQVPQLMSGAVPGRMAAVL